MSETQSSTDEFGRPVRKLDFWAGPDKSSPQNLEQRQKKEKLKQFRSGHSWYLLRNCPIFA